MAEALPPPDDDSDLPPLQTPVVVEDASGQQFDADASELDPLLRSGQFRLAPDQYQREGAGGVPVVVGGEPRWLPADQADAAIRSFEADATSGAAVEQEEERRYYQSPLQKARTVAAGGLRGLIPFGASDQALVALKPELADELAKFKIHNSELNAVSEIGGMALPFLAGGAGALGGGLRAAGAGVRGVAAGAEVAGAGVTRALGGGALARGAGAAVRGGLEVGAFEAGQEISAAALEKRELDAAKVASAFGHGALVGGALMGGGSLLFSGAKAGAAGAAALGEKAADHGAQWAGVRGAAGEGTTVAQDLGAVVERELTPRGLGASAAQTRELAAMAPEVRSKALEMAQQVALQSAEKKAAKAAEMAVKSSEQAAAAVEAAAAAGARADVATLVKSAGDDLLPALRGRSGPQAAAAAKEAEAWLSELGSKAADGDVRKLWSMRGDLLGEVERAALMGPGESFKRELLARVDGAINSAAGQVDGKVGASMAEAMRSAEAARWVEAAARSGAKAAERGAEGVGTQLVKAAGVVVGSGFSPAGVLSAAGSALVKRFANYGADVAGLVARGVREGNAAALSQAVERVSGVAVGRYLGAAQKVAAMPATKEGARGIAQAARASVVQAEGEISKRLFGDAPQTATREAPKPVRLAARTDPRKAVPAPTVRDVRARLEESRDSTRARYEAMAAQYPALAPEIAGSLKASERTHAYLLSTLPQSANQKHSLTPQAESPRLTPQQKADMATRVRVAESPLSVLASLEAGTLSRVEVEALQATAPEVYEQIRGDVQRQLDARSEPLPYKKALEVSLLLGVVGHPSLDPRAVQALQAAYAPPPPQAQPGPPAGAPKREIRRSQDWSLKGEVA